MISTWSACFRLLRETTQNSGSSAITARRSAVPCFLVMAKAPFLSVRVDGGVGFSLSGTNQFRRSASTMIRSLPSNRTSAFAIGTPRWSSTRPATVAPSGQTRVAAGAASLASAAAWEPTARLASSSESVHRHLTGAVPARRRSPVRPGKESRRATVVAPSAGSGP